jgi:nicotinamide mononucleotide transporter
MSITEIIAVSFSLLCVWFSVRKSVWNWPMGIVGVSAYLVLFYDIKLYADMTLQVFFLAQGFYGWYNWSSGKRENEKIVVSSLHNNHRLATVMAIGLLTLSWAMLLQRFTDASLPFVDAFASTTSLAANWLMARKKVENWIFWIIADLVYIGLFWYKGLYLSCGIYLLFLAMAVAGFLSWSKSANTNTVLR